MPGNDITLTAQWSANPSYNLTYDAGAANGSETGMPTPNPSSHVSGTDVTISTAEPEWTGATL